MELKDLGFDFEFYQPYLSGRSELEAARVMSVAKNSYTVLGERTEVMAELSGKLLYGCSSHDEYPTVGDWVEVGYFNDGILAIIHQVLPRKSILKRKMAGGKVEYQLIAANLDTAFIIQSLDRDFNIARLERYLTMVNEADINPVVLFSKSDLVSAQDLTSMIFSIKNIGHEYHMIPFSNNTGAGLDQIKAIIEPKKTYCLLGSSGVGKTTLINNLIGSNQYLTKHVREKDGKGKHATTRRQLVVLEGGGLLIDTPGMRELGSIDADSGLSDTFRHVLSVAENCRFKDCTHTNEPGCAILEALGDGSLDKKHFNHYLKLNQEIQYNKMSYTEKRRKERKFGKMCKQIMKHNKKL